jgi:hypothetical protein
MTYPGFCFPVLSAPQITLASAVLAFHHPIKLMDIYNYSTDATTDGIGSAASAAIWANFNRFNKIRATLSGAFGIESQLSARPSYVTESRLGIARATMEWELQKLKSKTNVVKALFVIIFKCVLLNVPIQHFALKRKRHYFRCKITAYAL